MEEKELHETQPVSSPISNPDSASTMPTKMHPLSSPATSPTSISAWVVILLLIFFPPLAWYFMWKEAKYHKWFPFPLFIYGVFLCIFFSSLLFVISPELNVFYDTLKIGRENTWLPIASYIGLAFAFFEILLTFILLRKNTKPEQPQILRIIAIIFFVLQIISLPTIAFIINPNIQIWNVHKNDEWPIKFEYSPSSLLKFNNSNKTIFITDKKFPTIKINIYENPELIELSDFTNDDALLPENSHNVSFFEAAVDENNNMQKVSATYEVQCTNCKTGNYKALTKFITDTTFNEDKVYAFSIDTKNDINDSDEAYLDKIIGRIAPYGGGNSQQSNNRFVYIVPFDWGFGNENDNVEILSTQNAEINGKTELTTTTIRLQSEKVPSGVSLDQWVDVKLSNKKTVPSFISLKKSRFKNLPTIYYEIKNIFKSVNRGIYALDSKANIGYHISYTGIDAEETLGYYNDLLTSVTFRNTKTLVKKYQLSDLNGIPASPSATFVEMHVEVPCNKEDNVTNFTSVQNCGGKSYFFTNESPIKELLSWYDSTKNTETWDCNITSEGGDPEIGEEEYGVLLCKRGSEFTQINIYQEGSKNYIQIFIPNKNRMIDEL